MTYFYILDCAMSHDVRLHGICVVNEAFVIHVTQFHSGFDDLHRGEGKMRRAWELCSGSDDQHEGITICSLQSDERKARANVAAAKVRCDCA